MILPAFLTFAAVVALADWQGPGHDWGGLAASVVLFFACRALGPRGCRWLLMALIGCSVAVAALAIVQFALWMPRARGPFSSPNFLGAYAVLMLFLAVAGQSLADKWFAAMSAAANLLSLALSQSRGALMALGAGLLVISWGSRRWRLWASLAALAAAGAVFLIRSDTTNPRMEIWWLGWQAAQQRLLLGWGQGGAAVGGLDRFYSIPLEWLIAGGIPAVAAGGWLLIAAWNASWPVIAAHRPKPSLSAPPVGTYALARIAPGNFRPFLAAWFVQGLVLFGHPATYIPLIAVLGYLASIERRRRSPCRSPSPLPRGSHGIS